VLSLSSGFAWLACGPIDRLRAHWVCAIMLALAAMLALHAVVGNRARRAVRGSIRATQGEGFRRAALVVSFAAIIVIAALRTTLVP
jgi:hypothetical protein